MAGILDIFINYFANPITWVFTGIFIMIGLLIGLLLRPWIGNQVIKISPANHTFQDLNIDEESSVSVQCKKLKGQPMQRFFKYHPGFTGIVGRFLKKPITRYLGMEGTAYTWNVEGGKFIKLGSLAKAVRTVLGEDFYTTIPERQKKMMDESRIQVTVGLEEAPLTPKGMRSISEEDYKQEEDRKASKTFWEENKPTIQGMMVNLLLAAGTGFGIACLLMIIGILRIPGGTETPEPANPASIIMFLKTIWSQNH